MPRPILDFRDADAFYEQALLLAQAHCKTWSDYWPQPLTDADVAQDVGLVMLKLFAQLAAYTAETENRIPDQRRLAFFQFVDLRLRPPLPAVAPLQFTLRPTRPARRVPAGSAVLMPPEQVIRFQSAADLLVVPAPMTVAMTMIPTQDEFIEALPVFGTGGTVPIFVADRPATLRDDPAEQPLGHWFLMGDPQLFKPDDSLQDITIDLVGKQLHAQYFGQWADGALTPLTAAITSSSDGLSLRVMLTQPPSAGPRDIATLQTQLYVADGLPAPVGTSTEADAAGVGASTADTADASSAQQPQYWLLARPAPQVKVLAALSSQLPVITGLQCTFRGKRVLPQQAAFDTLLLDIRNGAYPFGQTPQKNDSFYLRSDSVFAKTGAMVTLYLELVDVAIEYPVALGWQFWNGSQWQTINQTADAAGRYQFVDTTSNLQRNNPHGETYVQFQCPAMAQTTVAGIKGYWLRTTLLAGSYGRPGGFKTTGVSVTIDAIPDSILPAAEKPQVSKYLNDVAGVNFSYQFDPSEYAPPFIRSVQITYSYAATPASFWTYNAFTLSRFLRSPYKPVEQVFTGFYFAFAPGDFGRYTVGQKLTLYFHLAQDSPASGSALQWQWYDGSAWQPLAVDDTTAGLCRSGVVSFIVPASMPVGELFSQSAYWFRIDNPRVDRTILLHGVYPNVVLGRNVTTVENEVLGASNEQPDQAFSLKSTPVLAGMWLEVIEPAGLEHTQADLTVPAVRLGSSNRKVPRSRQSASAGAAATGLDRAVAVGTGAGVTEAGLDEATGSDSDVDTTRPAGDDTVYRRWRQVETFAFSGPSDRVFTLDHQNGLITFGNGRNGMVPPAGHNNIIARRYDATHGLAGNVPAGSLTLLRPGMSDIDGVTNPAPARGGVGGDTVADIDRRGGALVKAGGRAVELSDLSTLAAAADQRVAKARAIEVPVPPGGGTVDAVAAAGPRIDIAVLAMSADPAPVTSQALLDAVGRDLRRRCLAPLAARIHARSPDFVPVRINAQVSVSTPADQQQAVQRSLADALAAFMQPVFGGPSGQGWEFGQTLLPSAISQFLRRQASVTHVLGLSVNGVQNGKIVLAPSQLPVAGVMTVLAYSTATGRAQAGR